MNSNRIFGVAIVGCGTVGSATASLLLRRENQLSRKVSRRIQLKAILSLSFAQARQAGIDEKLFKNNLDEVLADEDIQLVVETVGGISDARTIIEKALKAQKHVVTANKSLLAHFGTELFALARENGVSIGFEASCGGGIPIIRALVDGLSANSADALYGIVNGTSNFILTEMIEHGKTYKEALKQAQADGLAEADPTLDVNGMDAAHKLTLLASLAFGKRIALEDLAVDGIADLQLFDVANGKELGYILKLVAFARNVEDGLEAAVRPVFLPGDHPLAQISGPFNAVSVYGDIVGHTMYYGRGAGGGPTASAVLSDIISMAQGTWPSLFDTLAIWPDQSEPVQLTDADNAVHRYYLRFNIRDESGAVAKITTELAKVGISLHAFVQKESHEEELVPVIITTHEAQEKNMKEAFGKICALPAVGANSVFIRIIEEHAEIV